MQDTVAATTQKEMSDAILKRYDAYIVAQVHQIGYFYRQTIHPGVLDLELDDIMQLARIKFWRALEKGTIHYPYAYIKLIIQSLFIDMLRRQKHRLYLSLDDELTHDKIEIDIQRVADPAETVVQQMEASSSLQEAIRAVLALPPRQQYAMICSLKERVDDLRQLIEVFQANEMDIQAIRWPAEKAEKQLLQASLVPAKKRLARVLEPMLLSAS